MSPVQAHAPPASARRCREADSFERLCDARHVLVAATREVDDDDRSRRELWQQLQRVRNRMRRLERGNYAFELRERLEAFERFRVRDVGVLRATDLAQPRVLRTD